MEHATATVTQSFPHAGKLIVIILLLATVLRFWGAFDLQEFVEDEVLHVTYAKSIGTHGTTTDWSWQHPQLSGLIVYGTIRIFGDNPVGWRISNIAFGSISVALVFLIGRLLYPGTLVPLLAASLLAMDPHHIFLSRTTFVEIPVTFFFLLYLYLLLSWVEQKHATLPLAGIAMGLTIGTKAYFFFALPITICYALWRRHQQGDLNRQALSDMAASLLLLPGAVYLLTYWQWFSRGYTLPEFVQMKRDAIWALRNMNLGNFINKAYLEAGGGPSEWFVKPLFWGHQRLLSPGEGIFLLQTNNPPFRLLVLPAWCASIFVAWRHKLAQEMLAPALFFSCYLLILLASRPMFSYSSAVLLPGAYLVLARAITICASRYKKANLLYAAFLGGVMVWGLYLFPLVSARQVHLATFRPILALVRYLGDF